MSDSRQLAGLIGPTMIVLGVTEALNWDERQRLNERFCNRGGEASYRLEANWRS